MNDSTSYERILKPPKSLKSALPRIGLILLYFLALSIWFVLALTFTLSPQILVLIPLTMALLILPTWKYGSVEYEYILSGGMLYCAKIYGKRKRKQMVGIDLSQAALIAPNDREHREKATNLSPTKTVYATVTEQAEDIWLIAFETEPKNFAVLFLHADEKTVRMFRKANPRATARISPTH